MVLYYKILLINYIWENIIKELFLELCTISLILLGKTNKTLDKTFVDIVMILLF